MRDLLTRAAMVAGLLALGLLGAACDDNELRPAPTPKITGTVLDAAGQPVAGAGILLQYQTQEALQARALVRLMIEFAVEQQGPVRVWITTPCDSRTLRVLVNGVLPVGLHAVEWDGKNDAGQLLPPGLYRAHITTATSQEAWSLLWDGGPFPPALPMESHVWHATTDADGRFAVPLGCVPFGQTVGGLRVLWAARVWALHPDLGAVSTGGFVSVDPEHGAQVELRYPALVD